MKNVQIKYRLEAFPEDISIEGNVLASGNSDEDRKAEQWVRDSLESGNEWAWCSVKVTAYIDLPGLDLEESDYLGACSYKSQRDFEKGGYFEDMKLEAKTRLLRRLAEIQDIRVAEEV